MRYQSFAGHYFTHAREYDKCVPSNNKTPWSSSTAPIGNPPDGVIPRLKWEGRYRSKWMAHDVFWEVCSLSIVTPQYYNVVFVSDLLNESSNCRQKNQVLAMRNIHVPIIVSSLRGNFARKDTEVWCSIDRVSCKFNIIIKTTRKRNKQHFNLYTGCLPLRV